MKNNSSYNMAKDIFVCHLGMSEKEAEAQLSHIFKSFENNEKAAKNIDLNIKKNLKNKKV